MKKALTLVIVSVLMTGASSMAFADTDDDLSAIITEGKIQAVMNGQKEMLIAEVNDNLRVITDMQEELHARMVETNSSSSNGLLPALGQHEMLMVDLLKQIENTPAADTAKLKSLKSSVVEIEAQLSQLNDLLNESSK